ncbi:MAG: AraC family transcriptional regulator, partial [Subtercola sp.]|nr:AraC family transcriptional regulator [Subtercola sp.]
IAAYKTDPDLTPGKVASTMNISLRQLQRAFAAQDSSVNDEIRQHRVDTAVGLLSNPAYRHLDLGQIAQYAGFGGRADLRRAIAAVHGCTPTQLRVSA